MAKLLRSQRLTLTHLLGSHSIVWRLLFSAALAAPATVGAADISGAGTTFPYPIYTKWAETYEKSSGVGLNYQPVGSGAAIKQIRAQSVTFGATDLPLTPEDLKLFGLMQFPMIIGGVVPVVTIKGVTAGQLHLDGMTIAAIYMGDITSWSDPAIRALNPKLAIPATSIVPVHRSDASGTTFLFTDYLSKSSPKFKSTIGVNTSVQWPTELGAKGNEGVAAATTQTDGAIGYVEYAYAKQNNLPSVQLINKSGQAVAPSVDTIQAAAAAADWSKIGDYSLTLTNQPGPKSWPITGASFIVLYAHPSDPEPVAEALKFFDWAYKEGGSTAAEFDYVPLPASLISKIRKSWATKITTDDRPVYTAK